MNDPAHTQPSSSFREQSSSPDWLRVNDTLKLFPVGRTTLYGMLSEGRVKSAVIKGRGNVRGIRLISRSSLEDFLNSIATGGNVQTGEALQ